MFVKRVVTVVILFALFCALLSGCAVVKVEEETGVKQGEEITADLNEKNESETEKSEVEMLQLASRLSDATVISAESPVASEFGDYDPRIAIRESYPIVEEMLSSVLGFTQKTAKALENEGDNLIYSPLSLYYALGILASGSVGQAESELTDLLGLEKDELAVAAEAIYRNIYEDNEIGVTRISNSIWVDRNKGISFKNDWLEKTSSGFFASVYDVDLNDPATGDLIGRWISDTTGKMLEYEFKPDPAKVMSIINSVYLSDQWTDEFDESFTKKDQFTNRDGSISECDFMNSEGLGSFYKTEKYSMSSIQLKNGGSVTFILPEEGVDPQSLLYDASVYDRISSTNPDDEAYGYGTLIWKVPKFSYQSDLDLVKTLRRLGVNSVFDTYNSLTDITDDPLFVSDVLQKATISVNEKGIEAAAYTEITYCGSAMPTDSCEMILDRPFAYIVETDYGIPIFVGVVNDMNQ
ncbi:MAG: serpin family protein [Clostridia bacterium]|nr:serpin family protein [Clostridia bacterium]